MKNIAHGILRLLVAFAGISIIYNYISSMVSYGSLLLGNSTVLITFLIFILLTLCVVIYMGVNSVREFMQKRIKLLPLYVVMAILTLVSLLAGTVRVSRAYATRPLHIIDVIYYLTLVLMVYFTVVDFIQQFIKKKKRNFTRMPISRRRRKKSETFPVTPHTLPRSKSIQLRPFAAEITPSGAS